LEATQPNLVSGKKYEPNLGGHDQKKSSGLDSKNVAGIFIAIALYVAFGFYVSNTSENKERTQAREAVERCREEADSYSGPEAGKNILADVCRKLEDELQKSLSHA
jgi:hypothetical protein